MNARAPVLAADPPGMVAVSAPDAEERCAAPERYCWLWRRYYPPRPYWDDASGTSPRRHAGTSEAWSNIEPTPLSSADLRASYAVPPSERCLRVDLPLPSSFGSAETPKSLRPLQWLHFPKCGSSFGTTLMHYGCPRIPRDAAADDGAPIVSLTSRYPRGKRKWCERRAFIGNLNGHEGLRYPEHWGRTVAMFRAPRTRHLSDCAAIFAEFVRAFPRKEQQTWAGRPRQKTTDPSEMLLDVNTSALLEAVYVNAFLREFLYSRGLSHADISALAAAWTWSSPSRPAPVLTKCLKLQAYAGCQTKMVLGVPCAAPFALNASLLREAVRRVREDFPFVGLIERWEQSICLFHRRFGGTPRAVQFMKVRSATNNAAANASRELLLIAQQQGATRRPPRCGRERLKCAPSCELTSAADVCFACKCRRCSQCSVFWDDVRAVRAAIKSLEYPWDTELYTAARTRFENDVVRATTPPPAAIR